MFDFTIETEIERTPAEVLAAYVTDATKLATWQTNTVSAVPETDGPLAWGPGSGKSTERPAERRSRSSSRSPSTNPIAYWDCAMSRDRPVGGRITVEPTEQGTRFRLRVYGPPTGASRLAEPLLRFILKRNFQRFCTTLKRVLEDAAARS